MTIELNQEQTDVLTSRALILGKTAEEFVVENLIDPIVNTQRQIAAQELKDAANLLSYAKRLELIELNKTFITQNA